MNPEKLTTATTAYFIAALLAGATIILAPNMFGVFFVLLVMCAGFFLAHNIAKNNPAQVHRFANRLMYTDLVLAWSSLLACLVLLWPVAAWIVLVATVLSVMALSFSLPRKWRYAILAEAITVVALVLILLHTIPGVTGVLMSLAVVVVGAVAAFGHKIVMALLPE